MARVAVVTGASSGVGRSVVVKLAKQGWRVAAIARRESELRETAALAGDDLVSIFPCDVSDERSVADVATKVEALGPVEVLVNGAGTNTKDRSLKDLSLETYRRVTEINLTGTYLCVQAFLPGMRQRRLGTIVNVVSDAAIQASPKAGAAYVVSKFGMRGLTQSINAEERPNGIRATAIFPGDIDTPLLNNRPVVPTAEQRANMMQPEDVAEAVMLAINLPQRVVIEELLMRPR
jgi:NAD(P)-dependent dehydrogenase (short-subunit alcohol dehydrogenase family)